MVRRRLTAEQVAEAADLYRRGLTLDEIARHLPASPGQIRLRLLDAGVQMRRRGPRPGRNHQRKEHS